MLWATNRWQALHQWVLNFSGAAVGCWALWLLWTRLADRLVSENAWLIGVIAFLGVTGLLPRFAVGIAFSTEKLGEWLRGAR